MLARCPEVEARFYDALRESFGAQARDGVHLSGLLNPRKEFWQHAAPIAPSDAELGFFSAGRGHEDALTRFLADDFRATDQEVIDGISMRPDFEAVTDRVIPVGAHAEFKTRRSNLPKDDAEAQHKFSSYRDQVRGYMALKRMPEMYLVVLSLVEGTTADEFTRTKPVFAVYIETATPAELEAERQKLYARRDAYVAAIAALGAGEDVAPFLALLPLCAGWMCGKATKTVTEFAGCVTCGQAFKTEEYGPRAHLKAKPDHLIRPAVVTWTYAPTCKWFHRCQPWLMDPSRAERN